ncbi:hypothetical protein D3C74_428790 [compost metagenome]
MAYRVDLVQNTVVSKVIQRRVKDGPTHFRMSTGKGGFLLFDQSEVRELDQNGTAFVHLHQNVLQANIAMQ